MAPRELAEIIFDLINKHGYDNVKNSIDSIFELYCSTKGDNNND